MMQPGAARLFQPGIFAPAAFQVGVPAPGAFQPGVFQPGLFQQAPAPMLPVREACFRALAARLAQLLGLPVERNRRAPIDASEGLPRLVVRDGGHQATGELAYGEMQYSVEVTVEAYAKAATEAALADLLNRLHARVILALVGAEIVVASGLSIMPVEESLELDLAAAEDAETAVGAFMCGLRFSASWPLGAGPFIATT